MKSSAQLTQDYWQGRYEDQTTGWDIGYASTPLKEYIDQLTAKDLRILIPGAGNAYEAGYLWEQGFSQVVVLDYAAAPLQAFKVKYPDFPESQLIQDDFFNHKGTYDLILEQTFFCAIDPELRVKYVKKCHELLAPNGKIVGVLWNKPMNVDRPPFGGNEEEYQSLFQNDFHLDVMAPATNSIKPRMGSEVFIKFRKKS